MDSADRRDDQFEDAQEYTGRLTYLPPSTSNAGKGPALERRLWPRILAMLVILDCLMLALAGKIASEMYGCGSSIPLCQSGPPRAGVPTSPPAGNVEALFILFTLVLFLLGGIYTRRRIFNGMDEYQTVFVACGFATLFFELARYVIDRRDPAAHSWLLFSWIFGAFFVMVGRFAARRALRQARKRGRLMQPALIVGAGQEAQMLEWHLYRSRAAGIGVRGYVDDYRPIGSEVVPGLRVVGRIDDLPSLIESGQIEQVFLATGDVTDAEAMRVLERVFPTAAELALAPNLFRTLTTGGRLVRVADHAVLQISKARIFGIDAFLKGTLDILGAAVLLTLTSPIWLIVLIAQRISAPGPLLVGQVALGAGGHPFRAWKFRTTGQATPQDDPDRAARRLRGLPMRDDPEVTPLGRRLRHYSIDELPQLLNVLLRQMSLVGPYKISPDQLAIYQRANLISPLTMRPGITGVCQTHGRGELTVEERALLDAEYVRTYTIWQDLHVLLATIPAVLHGRGAY